MNILFFGPNGSGKGTQGAILRDKYTVTHIESGAIFRDNIKGGTELGKKAKSFIDAGDLVPDEITIPMILDRLQQDDCKNGWLLDGFPRNPAQAEKLDESLKAAGMKLDYVVEIVLDREIAKGRLTGRMLCENDPNHPNNTNIPAIAPKDGKCRVCSGALTSRSDDADESAIDKRHDIYYDPKEGTLASAYFFKALAEKGETKYIELDGAKSVGEVTDELVSKL